MGDIEQTIYFFEKKKFFILNFEKLQNLGKCEFRQNPAFFPTFFSNFEKTVPSKAQGTFYYFNSNKEEAWDIK